MKKLLIVVFIFLLAGGGMVLSQLSKACMPDGKKSEQSSRSVPGDAEERSESDKEDAAEEENDETANLDHRWLSRGLSSDVNKHVFYQQVLFKNIERKVVIPPPKA